MLWPSIPNPCNSNAVQKIEGAQDLVSLKPIDYKLYGNKVLSDHSVKMYQQEVMELLSRPYIEETEEHVSVLEAKKDNKPTFIHDKASPSEDNEPLTTSTTIDSTPGEACPIDSNHLGSVDDLPVRASDIKDPPSALGAASVSTAVLNPVSVVMSDYTTMELFQQISNAAPAGPSSSGAVCSDPHQEYLRQSRALSENTRLTPDQTDLSHFMNCT